ncbi:MAG: hypothetical protein M0033_03135 [Nitrospiraceae bacterium]|nr:hypothetical protein [Nitrospiraceae bacterium]
MKTGRFFPVAVCFSAVFLLFLSSPAVFAARKTAHTIRQGRPDGVTMVAGHIEDVTSQAIRVNGEYYDFTGIENKMGQSFKSQLIRGRFVKLYFYHGALKNIMVFTRPIIQ